MCCGCAGDPLCEVVQSSSTVAKQVLLTKDSSPGCADEDDAAANYARDADVHVPCAQARGTSGTLRRDAADMDVHYYAVRPSSTGIIF